MRGPIKAFLSQFYLAQQGQKVNCAVVKTRKEDRKIFLRIIIVLPHY